LNFGIGFFMARDPSYHAAHLYQYRGPTKETGHRRDAPSWFHSLKVVVADGSVVAAAAKAASLESIGRSRMDIDHCGLVSLLVPCLRVRVAGRA
jgi:hypothetical protein